MASLRKTKIVCEKKSGNKYFRRIYMIGRKYGDDVHNIIDIECDMFDADSYVDLCRALVDEKIDYFIVEPKFIVEQTIW